MTRTGLSVERLTQFHGTDLEDLCDVVETAVEAGGGFGWVRPPPRDQLETYWKGVVLVPERQLFVGRVDGTIAASVQLVRPSRNNEAQAHQAQLIAVFVAPWARGRGLGRRLVLRVEEAAREAQVEILNLDLRETQSVAIALVESLGYVRWGEHPAYARVGGRLLRGFYYCKPLLEAEAGASEEEAELPARSSR
jgi:ribosomal protein S18 acetylase RimI-like enzyme